MDWTELILHNYLVVMNIEDETGQKNTFYP